MGEKYIVTLIVEKPQIFCYKHVYHRYKYTYTIILKKADFIIIFLTGVISLTSPFLQSSLHLTSHQESLNLFINDIQIIPELNGLFVKVFNEFKIPFFLIAYLLFNIFLFV